MFICTVVRGLRRLQLAFMADLYVHFFAGFYGESRALHGQACRLLALRSLRLVFMHGALPRVALLLFCSGFPICRTLRCFATFVRLLCCAVCSYRFDVLCVAIVLLFECLGLPLFFVPCLNPDLRCCA